MTTYLVMKLRELGLEKVLGLPWEESADGFYRLKFWNTEMVLHDFEGPNDWYLYHSRYCQVQDRPIAELTLDDFRYAFAFFS